MYTIASLMDAYTRADQFEKVLRLISRMKKEGRAPDNVVFNLLIDTYGRMGKPEEAEKVLCGAMKEYGIALETNNFTSVIEVHTHYHTHTHTHRIASHTRARQGVDNTNTAPHRRGRETGIWTRPRSGCTG